MSEKTLQLILNMFRFLRNSVNLRTEVVDGKSVIELGEDLALEDDNQMQRTNLGL